MLETNLICSRYVFAFTVQFLLFLSSDKLTAESLKEKKKFSALNARFRERERERERGLRERGLRETDTTHHTQRAASFSQTNELHGKFAVSSMRSRVGCD